MNFEHMGIRWGYAFLRTTSHAPGLEDLLVQAVEMYLMGEEERNVKTSNYEGELYTGGFGGQRFDAELETTQGRDSATFLVNEQTGAGSGFSRN